MKEVTEKLHNRYGNSKKDWLNFNILNENDLTFHHIEKAEDGGEYSFDNGALLTKRAQSYLHLIEELDYPAYFFLNAILEEINKQGFSPTKEQQALIENILYTFEELDCKKLCGNGKKSKQRAHTLRINSQKRKK